MIAGVIPQLFSRNEVRGSPFQLCPYKVDFFRDKWLPYKRIAVYLAELQEEAAGAVLALDMDSGPDAVSVSVSLIV